MMGVIWVVQVVHYPLFAAVGNAEFSQYEKAHCQRISIIVGPAMLLEAVTAGLLLLHVQEVEHYALYCANAALLAGIWASTVFLQMPQHRRLEQGFEAAAHARLVRSNWLRTIFWTLRVVLLLYLAQALLLQ